MQLVKPFTVDLTKTSGRGDFRCPVCGVMISPDDKIEDTYTIQKTEDIYTIQKTIMNGEKLDKIVLQCNKCKSQIHPIGFYIQIEISWKE